MKCKPWRWLWGLIGLLPLALFAIIGSRATIEADLVARSRDALKKAGLEWADIETEVRDIKLVGRALDEAEPAKAMKLLDETWGTRTIVNAATLLDKIDKYLFSATKTDNRVRLTGHVPSERVRAQVLAAVKAGLPGATIQDELKLGRGAPPIDAWIGGIGFAAKQLAQLKSGKAELELTALSLSGEATTSSAYRAVRAALSGGMPKGISLKQDAITAPVVKPYTWAAKLAAGQLSLSGHAPSDKAREDIAAAARRAVPKARVVDEMQIAAGEPRDFVAAASATLANFATLEDGTADIRDGALSFAGLTETAAQADGVKAALKRLPTSFRVTERIRHREPPPVSPYVTGVAFDGPGILLTGYVPSDEARRALVASVSQRFPGRQIRDQLQLASGQSAGWRRCVEAGMSALARVGNGSSVLTDRRLQVSGRTEIETLPQSLAGEARVAGGSDCDPDIRLTVEQKAPPPPAPPAVDEARLKAEAEARAKAEAEARAKAEADARARAEAEARAQAEAARRQQASDCQTAIRNTARAGVLNFKQASSEIEPASFSTLDRLAEAVKGCPDLSIEIEGHTDSDGTPERNLALSERRARAVVEYLTSKGVPERSLRAIGYGDSQPVAQNDTAANKALNRRIEFTVK